MNNLGWASAIGYGISLTLIVSGLTVIARAVWNYCGARRRAKALRLLYRDLNRDRVTPKFDLGDSP